MTEQYDLERLNEQAKRHLWMHFTRHATYTDHEVPIMVRGEGCAVWDAHGNRYLDGLSGLFVVQAGHGRRDLAEALVALGAPAAIVTGGHGADPVDWLFDGTTHTAIPVERHAVEATHGAGCTHSATLCALLAPIFQSTMSRVGPLCVAEP